MENYISGNAEQENCPLCGSGKHRLWATESGYNAVKCSSCGLVYVNPRPSASEVSEAVTMGQHQTEFGVLNVKASRSKKNISSFRAVVTEMFNDRLSAGRPVRWMDVGAGYGEFVEALIQTLTADSVVKGIEPMAAKAEYAKSAGLPIDQVFLSEVKDKYDVISLMNVFSHIPDFKEFLKEISDLLTPGGEVFIQTGNAGDLSKRSEYPDKLMLPDHLVFAGEEQIKRYFEESGFEIVRKKRVRVDTVRHAVKNTVKCFIRKDHNFFLPYTSKFRSVFYRAKKV